MRRCARLDVPGSTRRLAIRCLVLAFRINHHVDAGRPHFQFLFTNSFEMPSANLSVRRVSRQPRHTARLWAAQAVFWRRPACRPARARAEPLGSAAENAIPVRMLKLLSCRLVRDRAMPRIGRTPARGRMGWPVGPCMPSRRRANKMRNKQGKSYGRVSTRNRDRGR